MSEIGDSPVQARRDQREEGSSVRGNAHPTEVAGPTAPVITVGYDRFYGCAGRFLIPGCVSWCISFEIHLPRSIPQQQPVRQKAAGGVMVIGWGAGTQTEHVTTAIGMLMGSIWPAPHSFLSFVTRLTAERLVLTKHS